jgi:hypothetical protein
VTGPSVGRVVHYVPDDVPDWGGCRAAVVTEVDSVTAELEERPLVDGQADAGAGLVLGEPGDLP